MQKINFGKVFFIILISVTAFCNISAQDEGPPKYNIAGISTKGNRTVETDVILSTSGLNIGQEISFPSDITQAAINRLWQLKLFSDIKIYKDRNVGNNAFIVIEVEELPRVEKIEITGNDEFSNDDLKEKINFETGEVISKQNLKDIEYNIRNYYLSEKYLGTTVKVDELISANNEARVRIKIKEGSKKTLNKIIFQAADGKRDISEDVLKDVMDENTEATWWKLWDPSTFDSLKFSEVEEKAIIDKYRERGYRDAHIKSVEFKRAGGSDINLVVTIDEGKKYHVRDIIYPDEISVNRDVLEKINYLLYQKEKKVTKTPNSDSAIYKLNNKELEFVIGPLIVNPITRTYNAKKIDELVSGNNDDQSLNSIFLDNGYLGYYMDITDSVVAEDSIDLHVAINTGKQFKYGLIGFEGNDKTKDKVLRRELYSFPNYPFSRISIKNSLEGLSALNYFSPEKLSQKIEPVNDSTVNVTYLVEEKSSDQFNASIGYSGSFGVTGALGLTFNNFDMAEPFKGGAGQILSFNWTFGTGGTYRTFDLGFQEPWLFNTPTQMGFNIFDTRQNYSNLDLKETGASVNIGRRFKFPDDRFRGDWTAKFQRTNVINGDDFYQEGIRSQFSIKQIISRSSVFEPVFPTTGTRVSNSTELSGGPFLPGTVEFIKNIFSAEAFNPFTPDRKLVLYSNFQFSFINSFASDKYLPPTETFFMGGNGLTYNTIALRGYEDRSIGPKNSSGNPIGGRVAAKYGLELRYSLSVEPLPIFILGFFEAGNVWADITKTDPFDLRRSIGVGTRLILPAVGLVGFDFGYGFDRKIVDGIPPKWQFHFQFGRGF